MESGTPRHIGDVGRAIDLYMSRRGATAPSDAIERRGGSGEVRVSRLRSDKDTYLSIEDIRIEATINTLRSGQPAYFISMEFVNQFGIPVFHLDSRLLNVEFDEQEERTVMYTIRNSRLAQGDYSVNIFICSVAGVIDRFERATEFCIAPVLPYPGSRNDICGNALVYPDFSIEVIGQTAPDPIREVVTFL